MEQKRPGNGYMQVALQIYGEKMEYSINTDVIIYHVEKINLVLPPQSLQI